MSYMRITNEYLPYDKWPFTKFIANEDKFFKEKKCCFLSRYCPNFQQ